MTTEAYLKALKRLKLTPAGKRTAALLGLSVRQCIRIAHGEQAVPRPAALLLALYLRHGIGED